MNSKQLAYVKDMEHYGNHIDPVTEKTVVQMCCYCNGKNQGYMVQFSLWDKVIPSKDRRKMVCLGCFENKLGRPLVLADFTTAPINHGVFGFDCEIYCKLGETNET